MSRWTALLIAVLALNGASLGIAPSRAAIMVSALGCASAVAVLVWGWSSNRSRHVPDGDGHWSGRPIATVTVVGLFVVPLLSRWISPNVGFLKVDHRVQLTAAWLVLTVALSLFAASGSRGAGGEPAGRQRDGRSTVPLVLFIMWTSVLWFIVIWDLGVGRIVTTVDRSAELGDRLTMFFRTWESHPASQHLFLAWRNPANFADKIAYSNHGHPYLFVMYGLVKVFQAAGGVELYVASNLTPFVYMSVLVAALGVLLTRDGMIADIRDVKRLVALFLAVGLVVTQWRFWADLYRFNSDDVFPVVAGLLMMLMAMMRPPIRKRAGIALAAGLAALSPGNAPVVLLALACIYGQGAGNVRGVVVENRVLFQIGAIAAAAAGLSYELPRLLIAWRGYGDVAASVMFRSGLDGDVRYFTSISQAFAAPCCGGGRPLANLLLPAFVPLAVCGLAIACSDRRLAATLGSRAIFLAAPYVFSLVVFPQAVSIHPYLYDHLILGPAIVLGSWGMLSEPIQRYARGSGLLAFLLAAAGLLMSNLISLAQILTTIR
jgi:hypothetical protein